MWVPRLGSAGPCIASWFGCSVITAISQVFPVIQLVTGIIAYEVTLHLESHVQTADDGLPRITTIAGGFLCTIFMGAMVATIAGVLGWCSSFVLPARWFTTPSPGNRQHDLEPAESRQTNSVEVLRQE